MNGEPEKQNSSCRAGVCGFPHYRIVTAANRLQGRPSRLARRLAFFENRFWRILASVR